MADGFKSGDVVRLVAVDVPDGSSPASDYRLVSSAFRAHLQTLEGDGWDHFDDIVFKIAAGGLALSVTFLGVAKNVSATSMPWVFAAWALWSIALLLLLFSIVTAQLGLRSQIARWDAGTYYEPPQPPEGRWGRLTPWLNGIAVAACGLGLAFLLLFAFVNLYKGTTDMADKNSSGGNQNVDKASQFRAGGKVAPQGPAEQRGRVAPQAPPATLTTTPHQAPSVVDSPKTPEAGRVSPQAPPRPPAPPLPSKTNT